MEEEVRNRIIETKKVLKWTENSLASGDTATQKRLNRQISHGMSISVETILFLASRFPELSLEWLLRGEGEMLKSSDVGDADAKQAIYDLTMENTRLKNRIAELEGEKPSWGENLSRLSMYLHRPSKELQEHK